MGDMRLTPQQERLRERMQAIDAEKGQQADGEGTRPMLAMHRRTWRALLLTLALLGAVGFVNTFVRATDVTPESRLAAAALDGITNIAGWLVLLLPLSYGATWLRRWRRPTRAKEGMLAQASPRDFVPFRAVLLSVLGPLLCGSLLAWVLVLSARPPASEHAVNSEEPGDELTLEEKLELYDVFTTALQSPDMVGEVKPRFWRFIQSHGGLSDAALVEFREQFLVGTDYSRLFWEDAVIAVRSGRPFKSPERERLEEHLLLSGLLTDFRRRENEAQMRSIAAGQPITVAPDTEVVITEEVVRAALADFPRRQAAVEELFNRPE